MTERPANEVTIEYRVPYADTDQMQVVYYANYFVYFERLRNELIRATGLPYTEVEESGVMFPVYEANCVYHSSARYDDLLQITGWLEWAQGSRFHIRYRIENGQKELLVTGHTTHVVVSIEGNKPRRIPSALKGFARFSSEEESRQASPSWEQ